MKKDTQFVEETMKIINAIVEYKNKYGNVDVVCRYYNENQTFAGIVEYLNRI